MGCLYSFLCPCLKKTGEVEVKKPSSELFVPNDQRKCTNCYWMLFFGLYWIFCIVILGIGVALGDSDGIFYGTDYNGIPCSAKNGSHGPYIYYPQLSDDVHYSVYYNSRDLFSEGLFSSLSNIEIHLYGVCVSHCPDLGDITCNYETEEKCLECLKNQSFDSCVTKGECKQCWKVPLRTKSYFYRCLYELTETTISTEVCSNPKMEVYLNGSFPSDYIYPDDPQCLSKEVTTVNKKLELTFDDPVSDSLMTYTAIMNNWMSDIVSSWSILLIFGVILPIACGFLFILLIKYIISCFIYIAYFLLIIMSICISTFAFMKAGYFSAEDIQTLTIGLNNLTSDFMNNIYDYNLTNEYLNNITIPSIFSYDKKYGVYWKVGAWCSLLLFVLVIIFIFFTWRSMKVVVGVFKEASNALSSVPWLVLLPVFFIVQIVIVVIFFLFSSSYLTSINSISDGKTENYASKLEDFRESCKTVNNKTIYRMNCDFNLPTLTSNTFGFVFVWFNLFGFLWSVEFINGIFLMVIAGSIARWYFTKINQEGKKELENPICSSIFMVYRFHLGSIVVASFLIGVVKLIRFIIMYIKRQFEDGRSACAKCIFCCAQCCIWCFEKCLKFISRNAYIVTSIKGIGFWSAAKESFSLISSNLARFSLLNTTSYVIVLIGKLLISLLCGGLAYLILSGFQLSNYFSGLFNLNIGNVFIPSGVTLIVAYIVSVEFLGIYSMVVDTILVCFLIDENYLQANTKNSDCMPSALREAIGLAENREFDGEKFENSTDNNAKTDNNNNNNNIQVPSDPN